MEAQQCEMVLREEKINEVKLSIEELREVPGNENLSDQELQFQADTLHQLSLLMYDLYVNHRAEFEELESLAEEEVRYVSKI